MITYPNLYHLKYFVDAVALGSISGAAQKNLVTHPAVSRAIASLENHLGTTLLVHRKKSFQLTPEGWQVAEQAAVLLAAANDFGASKSKPLQEEVSEFRIGLSRTLSEVYLAPLLRELKTKFPRTSVKVRFGTTHEIVEAVANNSIDLGLTIGTLTLATLQQTVVRQGQFVLAESVSLQKPRKNGLEEKSFLLTEPRPETEKLKTAYAKHFDRPLPVLYEISSWDVISQLVQRGAGVGLLPDLSVKLWKRGSYRVLPTPWFEAPYQIYVHSLKGARPSRVLNSAKTFLEH